MGFSTKQVQALRRKLNGRQIRTREVNGRELSYIEGWFAISEANRIFGFDGWSRETVESRCVLTREGHGSGEGRGTSPGEVNDIALKAAETDATKRAFATFGKPFGLELYKQSRRLESLPPTDAIRVTRFGFHPDDTTPIPRPSHYYGRRQYPPLNKQVLAQPVSAAPSLAPNAPNPGKIDKSVLALAEPKRRRDKSNP